MLPNPIRARVPVWAAAPAFGAQVVVSGRNLATLWTKYPGIDPEANRLPNGNDDLGTPPALRTYNVRLNLAF